MKTAPLENLLWLQVLRPRDRIVQSNTHWIHRLKSPFFPRSLLRLHRPQRFGLQKRPTDLPTCHRHHVA